MAELGMIGLGRMGAAMVTRLQRAGHRCVVYDRDPEAVARSAGGGATAAGSLAALVDAMATPRAVWIMVPAAFVDATVEELAALLAPGDVVIDGGNSHYPHDLARSESLGAKGIDYLDVGTSGGVFGLERGYCLMIGGPTRAVDRLAPIFDALAPGVGVAERTPGRSGDPSPAERGWLHCGPAGAGHFVKMVHNGVEYGMMAAFAEGLNVLRHAGAGSEDQTHDAETTPLERPELYRYNFDLADITEVWRRGSVIASWLLDLTAVAFTEAGSDLEGYRGNVSDSGEGRWTLQAAIDTATPAPVLAAALWSRFESRDEAQFAGKVLSAMRRQFGGHIEKPSAPEERSQP